MAKTPQELFAETQAEYAEDQKAEAAKAEGHSGWKKGIEAFGSAALDNFTGGGASWLESVTRNWALPDDKKVSADDVRREWKELHDARSGLAAAGNFAGTAAQFSGVGKGINLAARGAQAAAKAAPWLARGGKAVETAMNAPGILGGAGSAAITGGVLGTGKEAARLATTDEEFNPWQTAGNIGLEAGLAGAGGGIAGAAASVLPKGVLAALQRAPVDPKTISRVQGAADHPIVQALGKTAPEGKASVSEAIRLADEPTLATLASKLSGLKQVAGKDNTGTLLADEAAGLVARRAKMGTIDKMTDRATRAETAAGKKTGRMENKQATPEAYWKIQDDAVLRAMRDKLIAEERAAAKTGYMGRAQFPMTAKAATKAAAKDVPFDTVSAITRMKPRANAEELPGIRGALEAQSPYFKALHDAQTTRGLGDRIAGGALGRGHATPPPQAVGLNGLSVASLLSPRVLMRELTMAGRDALQGAARKGAAQRELNMTPEELLRIVGRRTGTQKTLENILPASFLFGTGNL
jgi:hypothetical protein